MGEKETVPSGRNRWKREPNYTTMCLLLKANATEGENAWRITPRTQKQTKIILLV